MRLKLIYVLAMMFVASVVVSAQVRTMKWSTEFCQYSGTYDSKKYTEAQLRDTLKLAMHGEYSLMTDATAFSYEDIPKLSMASLENEYKTKLAALKALDIVHTKYFDDLKSQKLAEIEQVYELSRVSIMAYKGPKVLTSYSDAEACKKTYATPLIAGGNDLLAVWRKVNEDSRKNNSDPERMRRIFERQYASADKMKFAQVF